MAGLDFEIEIPFVENTGRRCVPACAAMILKTLMPEREFEKTEVEDLCGFWDGRSTWAAQHLLSLDELGINVGWIENDDLHRFALAPLSLMHEEAGSDEAFEAFIQANDLTLESLRVKEYLDRGLPFERRRATPYDIATKLSAGWLVRVEVNGKLLAGQEGYANHAVMVSGFNDDVARLENPDGLYGSKPKQIVSWDTLVEAQMGGHGAMHYYGRNLELTD